MMGQRPLWALAIRLSKSTLRGQCPSRRSGLFRILPALLDFIGEKARAERSDEGPSTFSDAKAHCRPEHWAVCDPGVQRLF